MKYNNIILGVLIVVIVVMGVAFAAFAQNLTINGGASIASNWSITFVAGTCTATTTKDSGKPSTGTVSVNGTTATVVANMASPGDVLSCTVKAQNQGSLAAKRKSWAITQAVSNSTAYTVTVSPTTNPGPVLAAKNGSTVAEETLTMTITFKTTVTEKPTSAATFKATATYEQAI